MAPRKTFPRFAELQAEALAWQVRNFGETPAWQQLLDSPALIERPTLHAGELAREDEEVSDRVLLAGGVSGFDELPQLFDQPPAQADLRDLIREGT